MTIVVLPDTDIFQTTQLRYPLIERRIQELSCGDNSPSPYADFDEICWEPDADPLQDYSCATRQ